MRKGNKREGRVREDLSLLEMFHRRKKESQKKEGGKKDTVTGLSEGNIWGKEGRCEKVRAFVSIS